MEGFLATLPAWLALHRTEWLGVPIDDRANSLIRLGTKTDESTAVRQLAQAARSAGFKQQIDAYLVGTYSPHLSIPIVTTSRRGLLRMVAAIGAMAGCSTVSSGASKLQSSYAAEAGVASVSVISRWQQETVFHDIWSADV